MPNDADPPCLPAGDLLAVAPVRLDDACFAVPAIRALAAHKEVSALSVLCGEDQADLWNTLPGIHTISYPVAARPATIASIIVESGGIFAAAVAWEPGNAAEALKPAGISQRFGPEKPAMGRHFQVVSVTRRPGPVEHRVQDFLLLAKELGARPFEAAHFAPVNLDMAESGPSIALVPDSDFGASSQWNAGSWLEVGGKLIERHRLHPTIIGPGPVAEALATELGDSADFEQPATLQERIELLARHRVLIACDGTSPHLAAHLGATCAVLFGPNDPNWRRPLGKRHIPIKRHVECAPCLLPDCPLDHRCMEELDAGQVLDAIGPLLDGVG